MHINLTGAVAVVTGAGRGIGRDLALRLAEEGVHVVGWDVGPEGLDALAEDLRKLDARSRTMLCDVRDADRVAEAMAEVHSSFGAIDILVNNAGVVGDGAVESLDEQVWRRIQDVNVTGTFLTCRAAIPLMKRQGSGRIINAASFAAISPRIGSIAYATSKAAVAHFTRGLAGELGPWDITVNAYAPGMIPTQMNLFEELPQEKQAELLDTLTLRRWGSTEDIANLVCFLASEQASYITGSLIDVSGGKLATQLPAEAYALE